MAVGGAVYGGRCLVSASSAERKSIWCGRSGPNRWCFATTMLDALDGTVRYDVIIDIAGNRPMRDLRRGLTPRGTVALVSVETGGRLAGGFLGQMLRGVLWSMLGRRRFRMVPPTERGEDIETVVELAGRGEIAPRSIELSVSPTWLSRSRAWPTASSARRLSHDLVEIT